MAARRTAPARGSTGQSPSEIAPHVFVGSWKDAEKFDGKRYCVLDEMPADAPADEGVPIYDDEAKAPIVGNLDRVVGLMRAARERNEPVLVFCGHGVRRAPMAGAWYLHRVEGLALDEAYRRLRSVRPQTEHARDWAGHWEVLRDDGRSGPAARGRD